jgi:magnesium transporter
MPSRRIEKQLDEPITAHMRTDFTPLNTRQTVEEALATIRESSGEERIIYFYVVDDEGRLKGVVPTRRLLLSPLEKRIADIMVSEVIAVPKTATVLETCEFFIFHRLLAFPVVDAQRRVIGKVDVELYTTELADLDRSVRKDDLFQLIGVHLAEARQTDPLAAFRNRFPWLVANIAGGIVAAFLAGFFEVELQKAVALSLFIPVVLALAESVSIQSLSLALELLHGRQPTVASIVAKVRSEAATGALLGAASAVVVGGVALLWLGQVSVALALLGGIAGSVTCAAVIGVAMPNVLRLLQREPQVASGPVALATTDIATLLIYFNLARWLL